MAQEQSMRVIRQASDDAREMAMRVKLIAVNVSKASHYNNNFFQVIHDPGLNQNLDNVKGQAENVWRAILEVLKSVKEAVKAPNALLDQLQIIFRDESKLQEKHPVPTLN